MTTTEQRAVPAVRAVHDGVAVVMPAYREEDNLASTVEDFLAVLESRGVDHAVVVVDDGSPDGTGAVLDELAARHPGRVIAARHERNRGYGAAVRTGVSVALERTDLRLILLTDSDGQFKAADLPALLRAKREQRADAVIGYRRRRADPVVRRFTGRVWTLASRVLLGTRSRDVDCAYKLLDRRVLDGLRLAGDAAAIDPEILAKIGGGRARIVEHPVAHHPREHGRPTGASPWVIAASLVSLVRVYRGLVAEGYRWRWARWICNPRDPVLALVTVAAAVLSVCAFVHHLRNGTVLAYNDSVSHLLISRRVIDGPTPGAAQLGGVWPPLPHLLALPLVWSDALFYSGFAGAAISMAAYVAAVRYVYLIAAWTAADGARLRARDRAAGVAAAGLFALNANVLYMQSTPMTELPLFACVAATVHHLQAWCRTGRYARLAAASCGALAATLTRYAGWVRAAAAAVVVGYVAVRRWRSYAQVEAHVVFFGIAAFGGIAGWVCWSYMIFGDPLYWYSGEYADPSMWVSSADANVGDLVTSARTYALAMVRDLGAVLLVTAVVGVLVHVWRRRGERASVAPYVLLVFVPFYVYSLYTGQRPLHVPEIHGDSYNVRFALVVILAAAVFTGYLVSLVPRLALPVAVAGAVATVLTVPAAATLAEPTGWRTTGNARVVAGAVTWLRGHYDGGRVLMENYGNEPVVFGARLPIGRVVYEGSFRIWRRALADPAGSGVRWIYARTGSGEPDLTWRTLRGRPALTRAYTLVYQDEFQRVYRRTDSR